MAIREVDVEALHAAMEQGALVVDVRQPDEYVSGHVPGAVLVPLGEVPGNVRAFRTEPPGGTVYVICRSGARSMRACEFVAQHDIDAVNVAGGTLAWVASGRDVVTGSQAS